MHTLPDKISLLRGPRSEGIADADEALDEARAEHTLQALERGFDLQGGKAVDVEHEQYRVERGEEGGFERAFVAERVRGWVVVLFVLGVAFAVIMIEQRVEPNDVFFRAPSVGWVEGFEKHLGRGCVSQHFELENVSRTRNEVFFIRFVV